MISRVFLLLVAGVLAGQSGCGPARVDSPIKATLERSSPDANFDIPSVNAERTIVVEASSSGSEIDIYVVKSSDAEKFISDSYENRATKGLGAKQKIKSDTLEVKVPADTEARVIIMLCDKGDMKKSDITGRITSKK